MILCRVKRFPHTYEWTRTVLLEVVVCLDADVLVLVVLLNTPWMWLLGILMILCTIRAWGKFAGTSTPRKIVALC